MEWTPLHSSSRPFSSHMAASGGAGSGPGVHKLYVFVGSLTLWHCRTSPKVGTVPLQSPYSSQTAASKGKLLMMRA